ncbi:hypothetical protein EMIHUDRAFT_209374 [Emiliania huxleyi CCMP1516]|uniref:LRRK2 ARM repeat domain-containing protein n=2 Tax=Emiliania huxleyi TaxID=2903 RepID=A0A0D3J5K8_EMIH1|nr:hypothetical protein EMIHUDRAFT_209374 [Emiliania huxleyi CCMP1516]EOD18793.1 hypothetical protein EMIHUDRAFT_209374 [Emiliania huxleyi CCMP1516]|eukprot:XP_005771222.1 hypothetical protein EMIHUDRAFT_209374 [Emiliania huxleyi CCMP1516]
MDAQEPAAVVASMREHISNVQLQRDGCSTLLQIGGPDGSGACKQAVVEAGGLAAVVAAMGGHATDVVVQTLGCDVVGGVLATYNEAREQAVVDAGGLAAVVAAMGRHATDEEVQRAGCFALRNMAAGRDARKQAVVDAGGPAAVVAAMGRHATDEEVQRAGCFALRNMAAGCYARKQAVMDACKRAVVDAGGATAVVAAMGRHAADVELQRAGCGALETMGMAYFGCDAFQQAVVDAGGLAAVVAAMGRHAADAKLQRAGCGALQNMAAGRDARRQAVVDAGGATAVVAAMGGHAADMELQRAGCDALYNMAEDSDAGKQAVLGAGGLAALAERARRRAEQRALQMQEQREEAERRAQASQQGQQGLQQQLTAAQQTNARLQAEIAQLRAASQSAQASAIDRLVDSSSPGGGLLSVAAGPLTHFNSQYQGARRRCYSSLDIWRAAGPASPFGTEVSMLRRLWAEGGRGRQAGPNQDMLPMGFTLTRIEAIDVPASDRQAFYNLVEQMDSRRSSGTNPGPFNPIYPGGDRTGEKAAVFAQLRARFLPRDRLQNQNIMLALHGCSHAVADNVCKNGFAVVPYRDEPWFGRGLYLTTYAECACRYATGEFKEQPNPPNSAGEHVLIAAFVAPGMVYPVSRKPDYARPSNLTSSSKLKDRALQPQFNSHYAFVSAANNYECMDGARNGAVMDYDELVCGNEVQALPAYRLYFRAP